MLGKDKRFFCKQEVRTQSIRVIRAALLLAARAVEQTEQPD